jgi:hypothetical protein
VTPEPTHHGDTEARRTPRQAATPGEQGLPETLPYAPHGIRLGWGVPLPTRPVFWVGLVLVTVATSITLVPFYGLSLGIVVLTGATAAKRPWLFLTMGALVAGLLIGRDLTAKWWRPMFHGPFYVHKRTSWRIWYPTGYPVTDQQGNACFLDSELNLFAVVLNPSPGDPKFFLRLLAMEKSRNQAALNLTPNGPRAIIPRASSMFVVIFPDGTRAQSALAPGEAQWMRDVIIGQDRPADLLAAIEIDENCPPQDVIFIRSCRQELLQLLASTAGAAPPVTRPSESSQPIINRNEGDSQ